MSRASNRLGELSPLSFSPTSEPDMKRDDASGPLEHKDLRETIKLHSMWPSTSVPPPRFLQVDSPPNTALKIISWFTMLCNCAVRSALPPACSSLPEDRLFLRRRLPSYLAAFPPSLCTQKFFWNLISHRQQTFSFFCTVTFSAAEGRSDGATEEWK